MLLSVRRYLPLLLLAAGAFAQQDYVSRYDLYVGYAFLDSPKIGLFENGVHVQAGMRPRTWLSLGFDYSHTSGSLSLTPDLLPNNLQQLLAAQLAQLTAAGQIPPGYVLKVPANSVTDTFAAGPQYSYRHFKHVTIFLRPSVGAIHEQATPAPTDPIASQIVTGFRLLSLVPASGTKTDWQGFYGVGFGFDVLFSKHFGWRTQSDVVWDHLFNDILKDGRWTVRFSVGPCFNFGRNIVQ